MVVNNSLQKLSRTITKHGGVAPSNRFWVIFNNPSITSAIQSIQRAFTPEGIQDMDRYSNPTDVAILASKVNIPGYNLMTQEYRESRHTKTVAHSMYYNDVTMSFILTNDHYCLDYFRAWMNSVLDRPTYRLNYKDNYAKDITVITMDQCNMPTNSYRIFNAYPTSITEVEFRNELNPELVKINVTFKYDDFNNEKNESDYIGKYRKITDALASGNTNSLINAFGDEALSRANIRLPI